jgi:hypothetical protein
MRAREGETKASRGRDIIRSTGDELRSLDVDDKLGYSRKDNEGSD